MSPTAWGRPRGKAAEENELITVADVDVCGVLPKPCRRGYRLPEERHQIVTEAVRQRLAEAQPLHEITTERDGLLWRKKCRIFADSCSRRRAGPTAISQAGCLISQVEQRHSPIGENCGVVILHLRPVCQIGAGGAYRSSAGTTCM